MARRIAIIGGGIGGLTLGIDLRQRGFEVDIYESTSELREVGAAVGLSANSLRYYQGRIGIGDKLAETWADIRELIFRHGKDGSEIARIGPEVQYQQRYGSPWIGIHRAELQAALAGAYGSEGLHLSRRLTGIRETGTEAVLDFADGSTETADLVIGADGVRSTTRRLMLGYDDALFSGCSGTRGIVAPELLSELPDPEAIQFWVGPQGHLLHYPIGGGAHNFLLVRRDGGPWAHRQWVTPIEEGSHVADFEGWHPAVQQMITAVPVTERWALFHRPPLSRWSRGRVTLIGDAAHAMVPHHGQGANQSIEDAIVLSDQLVATDDWDAARAEYERLRRGRTRRVQVASITTADVLHLPPGPRADERDARLGAAEAFDRHLAWIHEYKAEEEPAETSGGTWL